MNTVIAPKAQVPDVAGQITYAMRSMGVAPIPRNYELFYEAYIGSNPVLTRELAALGSNATQEELDAISARHFARHSGRIFDEAHTRIITELMACCARFSKSRPLWKATTGCLAKPASASCPRITTASTCCAVLSTS